MADELENYGGDQESYESESRGYALSPTSRVVAGLVGAGGLGAGTFAVFTRDVEAGPVALLAIGAFFGLLSAVGVMPSRLRIGENEAEWPAQKTRAVAGFVEASIEDAGPAKKPELIAEAEDLLKRFPELNHSGLAGVLHEERVAEVLNRLSDKTGGQLVVETRTSMPGGVDFLVRGPTGKKVALMVTATRTFGLSSRIQADAKQMMDADPTVVATLLVLDHEPTSKVRARFEHAADMKIVVVRTLEDDFDLMAHMRRLLDLN